jgi:hypothetical protein
MLSSWEGRAKINSARIGLSGMSSGGLPGANQYRGCLIFQDRADVRSLHVIANAGHFDWLAPTAVA